MKVGILTFHSQLNYGGVLQCWALQTALEEMGHEAIIIDRWLSPSNGALECGYNTMGLKAWTKFLLHSFLGLGDFCRFVRSRRTKRFLRRHLNLTPYHFVDWSEAPKDLGVDMLVVGSDQVWHCGDWSDPKPYLLEGAPEIPAISYAASFGLTELPVEFVDIYKRGLSKFKAVSCREAEGVKICQKLGFDATHVVDPTLLAWGADAEAMTKRPKRRELVCYFLSERVDDHIATLESFARQNKCRVQVFMNKAYWLPFPKDRAAIKEYVQGLRNRLNPYVRIMDSVGPQEFIDAFKQAKWVVSDSFHALMFSICYGGDPRIIKPSSLCRQKMFARINEFAARAKGPLIVNSVPDALASFANGEKVVFDRGWLSARCTASLTWLRSHLIPNS